MTEPLTIKHTDARGRVRWQPLDQHGRGKAWGYTYVSDGTETMWRTPPYDCTVHPCLYRSRRRAERIARRKNRRDDKREASVFVAEGGES